MKKWLFFDVGSTLIDETECEKQRIIDTINGSSISYYEFYHNMEYYACCNMNFYKCALERCGLKKVPWKSELETIYPQADYVSSSDIGFAKPDERIFKFALKQANCPAQNACMIGDRLDNDIIPAQHIGMRTVWIKQGFGGLGNLDKLSTFPDYIVENLSELLNLQF